MPTCLKTLFSAIIKNKSRGLILILFFLFTALSPFNITEINEKKVFAEEIIIPILTYHNFTQGEGESYKINIQDFEEQLDYLARNNYTVISLSQLLEGLKTRQLPAKPVVLTIDDGYKATYTLAFPILKKYNFPVTLFLYTDFIEKNPYTLTWEEIREMTKNNLEIGSHTLSHSNLLRHKENESYDRYISRIKKEIFLSKEILETKTESLVKFFAYPYGIYSPTIKDLAIQAGYEGIVNANGMNNTLGNLDLWSLDRQIIYGNNSFTSFIEVLNQEPLPTSKIFPPDGAVLSDQHVKIGAILEDSSNIEEKSLSMKLGGAKVKHHFSPENREISYTPLQPLIKKSYIVSINALGKTGSNAKKTSWLITIN